jgi:hypothetical protein
MWYWMLPSAVITGVTIIIPQYVYGLANYVSVGQVN